MKILAALLIGAALFAAHPSTYCRSCARDPHGRIRRDPAVRREFRRLHPCPSTGRTTGACPGFVADHIKPLACGGFDSVRNLQWLSKVEDDAKNKIERRGCHD